MAARTPDGRTTAASSMTTAEVRFGYPAARSKATMPPMLCPTTAGFSSLSQLAHPRKIVGKDLHRVRLVRLVAPSVPAQVHGHDTATFLYEVLELAREVGVVAAPAVHQQDGRLPLPCFLVGQGHPVELQLPHQACLPPCEVTLLAMRLCRRVLSSAGRLAAR